MEAVCPNCRSLFQSLDALVHHLNTDGTSCISTLEDSFEIPTPPAFIRGAGETNVMGEYHEHSGYIYGKGEILLDCIYGKGETLIYGKVRRCWTA